MGFVIVMLVGVLAALSFTKKELYQPWIYLVNVSLAVYLSMFTSPLLLELLPALPAAAEKYKTAGILLVTAVLLLVIFYKIVGTVAEDSSVFDLYPLPSLVSNLCAAIFAFCGGAVTAAFLLMCFAQTPISAKIKGIDRAALRTSSTGVMRTVAGVVNVFSFQSMSREAQATLDRFEKDPPPVPEESLEEKVKAKKAEAAKKAKEKARKKMRILENGVAVPVEEETSEKNGTETQTPAVEKTAEPSPAAGEKGISPEPPEKTVRSRKQSSSSVPSGAGASSSEKTTVYGRAVSKAVDVRRQIEKKSVQSPGEKP